MKLAFLVYGALYVVIEIVGHQLEQVSWPEITALDVATALTNAFLTVTVLVAVLVAVDVLGHRWRRHLQAVRSAHGPRTAEAWTDREPLTVPSWRPEPLALPAGAAPVTTPSARSAYTRPAWPDDVPEDRSRRLI